MNKIRLLDIDIPYKIANKKNKNTYFYFKREGYIQINLSANQDENDAILYMLQNDAKFVKKYKSMMSKQRQRNEYHIWGIPYKNVIDESFDTISIDHDNKTIYSSCNIIDQPEFMNAFEKLEMKRYIDRLADKWKRNVYVNIDNVTYRFQPMKTRHGSCNHRTRRISINTKLMHLDPIFTEYVFLHEIAHLDEPNHSKHYYELLRQLCPMYKDIRQKLKKVW